MNFFQYVSHNHTVFFITFQPFLVRFIKSNESESNQIFPRLSHVSICSMSSWSHRDKSWCRLIQHVAELLAKVTKGFRIFALPVSVAERVHIIFHQICAKLRHMLPHVTPFPVLERFFYTQKHLENSSTTLRHFLTNINAERHD